MKKRVKFIVFCTLFLFSISYGAYAMYEANRSVLDRNIEAMSFIEYGTCPPGYICEGMYVGTNDSNYDPNTLTDLISGNYISTVVCGKSIGPVFCPQAGYYRNWAYVVRMYMVEEEL